MRQRPDSWQAQLQHFVAPQGLLSHAMLKRLTLKILHDDERLALLLANLMNGADVGMIQRRGSAGLALETLQPLAGPWLDPRAGISAPESAELRVFSSIHHTHPTTTELLEDPVVRDGRPDHRQVILDHTS